MDLSAWILGFPMTTALVSSYPIPFTSIPTSEMISMEFQCILCSSLWLVLWNNTQVLALFLKVPDSDAESFKSKEGEWSKLLLENRSELMKVGGHPMQFGFEIQ
ncbi:hypothetical protein J5N97_012607 [Dioscorea zingiberensis]|uniref:Uncharacterized protein n=1 Tax=Dioscorea zingiberensis TaxID=325984 RepID=A0A9D5HHZ9_9LILI|nr:hypothetical protein J5N97_012607 [Dioscorea zingiberensis]